MKKIAMLLLTIGLSIFVLAACGSNNDDKSEGKDSDEKKELTFVSWSSQESSGKMIEDVMAATWNEENPDTKIKVMGYPWDETLQQLILKSKSSDDLDIAQIQSSWFNTLAAQDVLVDLNTVLDPEWITDSFTEAALEAGQSDGKQFALPWTVAAIAPLYNPELLESSGVDEVPTTVAEFEEALGKIKEANPDVIPYAFSTESAENVSQDFQSWLWTFGGNVFDDAGEVIINNEKGLETLEWLTSLMEKDYIQMGMKRVAARDSFGNNKVAFYDDSIVARGFQLGMDYTMEEMPNHMIPMLRPVLNDGDTPQSVLWGHYAVVFEKSKDTEKSAEFIQHMLQDDMSIEYFEAASVPPVTTSAKEDPVVKEDDYVNKYLEVADSATALETEAYTEVSELNSIITEEVQAALLGNKTPQKAVDEMASRLSEVVGR